MAVTISHTAYNLLVDDDGSGTTGTVWSKSNVLDILDAIDVGFAALLPLAGGTLTGNLTVTPFGLIVRIGHTASITQSDGEAPVLQTYGTDSRAGLSFL